MHPLNRRALLRLLALAGAGGWLSRAAPAADDAPYPGYRLPSYGNARLLHLSDCHAQLTPLTWYQPPAAGAGPAFVEAAARYGEVGGFAHLATLVRLLRDQVGGRALLLDGGGSWLGSAVSVWQRGRDMVGAGNLLGVDVMTGHWELTLAPADLFGNLEALDADFVAHNVHLNDAARARGAPAYDRAAGRVFPPYTVRRVGGQRIAVIGQAYPFLTRQHPAALWPDWSVALDERGLQRLVEALRERERPDAVVLLSHSGPAVDLKLARRSAGIDAILGGHGHDALPRALEVRNRGGTVTLVTTAGAHGACLGVLDLALARGRVDGYRFRLLPVFSRQLAADPDMDDYVTRVRSRHRKHLRRQLATSDRLLYRRGTFDSPTDSLLAEALRALNDVPLALTPGFRWGETLLPGAPLTFEWLLDQTALLYPQVSVREVTGAALKALLEDAAEGVFASDPYRRHGHDMPRVGGLRYRCAPGAAPGRRIDRLRLVDGAEVVAGRRYRIAGWGHPALLTAADAERRLRADDNTVWRQLARYLRGQPALPADPPAPVEVAPGAHARQPA